jgi:hypothetical protein
LREKEKELELKAALRETGEADLVVLANLLQSPPRVTREFADAADQMYGRAVQALQESRIKFMTIIAQIGGIQESIMFDAQGNLQIDGLEKLIEDAQVFESLRERVKAKVEKLRKSSGSADIDSKAEAVVQAVKVETDPVKLTRDMLKTVGIDDTEIDLAKVIEALKTHLEAEVKSMRVENAQAQESHNISLGIVDFGTSAGLVAELFRRQNESNSALALAQAIETITRGNLSKRQMTLELLTANGVVNTAQAQEVLRQIVMAAIASQLTSVHERQGIVRNVETHLTRTEGLMTILHNATTMALDDFEREMEGKIAEWKMKGIRMKVELALAGSEVRYNAAIAAKNEYAQAMESISGDLAKMTGTTLSRFFHLAKAMVDYLLKAGAEDSTIVVLANGFEQAVATTGIQVTLALPSPAALLGLRGSPDDEMKLLEAAKITSQAGAK